MHLIVPLLLTWPAAGPTASEILAQVDDEASRAEDQFLVYDMVTRHGDEVTSSYTIRAATKGRLRRRVDFLAPADRKGVKLLVLSPTQMYIYLPEFRKVRRVASHVQEQGFMGTAYDHAEVSLNVFGEVFEPTGMEDRGDHWTLFLKRRDGQDYAHARLEVDVHKKYFHPTEIRYIDDAGKVVKTEKRTDFVCADGFCRPKLVTMTDHRRGELVTVMTMKAQKVNTGAPDSFFTLRALEH